MKPNPELLPVTYVLMTVIAIPVFLFALVWIFGTWVAGQVMKITLKL